MRFIIGTLIAIGLLIFVFVLILRGGGGSKQAPVHQLIDYSNTSTFVQLTEEGPVSAEQTHRTVRITVSNQEASIETFNGYLENLVTSKTYNSNSEAYADFLRALDLAGYTKGNSDKAVADERGYCEAGTRYVMEIKDGEHQIQRYWNSSCNVGSFKGKTSIVLELFHRQIPDYSTVGANFIQ
jgi:hypothetical protein